MTRRHETRGELGFGKLQAGQRDQPQGGNRTPCVPTSIPTASRQAQLGDQEARPGSFSHFVGQRKVCDNLKVFIAAARRRGSGALDHILFHGPPGLGKTTLAAIVAGELGVGFRALSAPAIARPGDLAALLTRLGNGDVFFLDEIHRLHPAIEEVLYLAMEDFRLDVILGKGPGAKALRLDLAPFTLIGATTRLGLMTKPLRDRFGITMRLDFYHWRELEQVVSQRAGQLGLKLAQKGAQEIARRARGTPRTALRLLRRVADFSEVDGWELISKPAVIQALARLEVDECGLDATDHHYLSCIARNHNGGPVGLETLSAALCEERDVIEDIIEPYLLRQGYLRRTSRGRVLTDAAYRRLELTKPSTCKQDSLFLSDERK